MENITYENQGNNTYMVYEIQEFDEIDKLSLGMISNNKIVGLSPVLYTQLDEKKYLKYNISAKVSASTFLAGTANKNRILGVFSGVSKALLSAEEYMLDANTIMLDLDYIFVDVTTCEAELICLPIEREFSNDVLTFFKNIIFSITYDQTENCDYVAKIISCLNNRSGFSLASFMQTIDELRGKRINISKLQSNQQEMPEPEPQVAYTEVLSKESSAYSSSKDVYSGKVIQINLSQNSLGVQQTEYQASYNGDMQEEASRRVAQSDGNIMQNENRQEKRVTNESSMQNTQVKGDSLQSRVQAGSGMSIPNFAGNQQEEKKFGRRNKGQNSVAEPDYRVPGAPEKAVQQMNIPNGSGHAVPNRMFEQPAPLKKEKSGIFGGIFGKKDRNKGEKEQSAAFHNGQQIGYTGVQGNQQAGYAGQQSNQQPVYVRQQGGQQTGYAGQQNISGQQTQGNIAGVKKNYGETVVLSNNMVDGETSVLSPIVPTQPYLERKKTGEKVFITSGIFRIGKQSDYVDYFIADNPTISRSHANIMLRGSDYVIVDTNSKNHTYVNGQMIPSNVETKLVHGTIIKLANEEFEFKMY